MSLLSLIASIALFIAILSLLLYLYFKRPKALHEDGEEGNEFNTQRPSDYRSLEEILEIVRHPKSRQEELAQAVELIIKYHLKIDDLFVYEEIIAALFAHPHSSSALVLRLDKELRRANKEHASSIDMAINLGLQSRG